MENSPNIPALQESIENNNNFIRYNPERIDYSINEAEINLLSKRGQSYWKDVLFISIGIGVPSIANMIIFLSNKSENNGITIEFLVNSILISVSFVVSILSLIGWKKDENEFKDTIEKIKNKPLHVIPRANKEKRENVSE